MLVFTIVATDIDTGVNSALQYAIDTQNDLFAINRDTGAITLAKSADFEVSRQHTLTIRVYDQGSPRLTSYTNLTVDILDRNDNQPVFFPPAYMPNIFENPTPGLFVVQVRATDRDHLEHMNLDFSLIDDPSDPGHFVVTKNSSTSAVVTVSGDNSLDTERQSRYVLFIRATDNQAVASGGHGANRDNRTNIVSAEVSS